MQPASDLPVSAQGLQGFAGMTMFVTVYDGTTTENELPIRLAGSQVTRYLPVELRRALVPTIAQLTAFALRGQNSMPHWWEKNSGWLIHHPAGKIRRQLLNSLKRAAAQERPLKLVRSCSGRSWTERDGRTFRWGRRRSNRCHLSPGCLPCSSGPCFDCCPGRMTSARG